MRKSTFIIYDISFSCQVNFRTLLYLSITLFILYIGYSFAVLISQFYENTKKEQRKRYAKILKLLSVPRKKKLQMSAAIQPIKQLLRELS